MPFQFNIPIPGNSPAPANPHMPSYPGMHSGPTTPIELDVGEVLFIVGANGTGKSSLSQLLYSRAPSDKRRRLSAHRQTWFQSNTLNLTAASRRDTGQNIINMDAQPQARWKDDYAQQRASMTIFDIIDAQNIRARSIADAVDKGNVIDAQELSRTEAPLTTINSLLKAANLPIEISISSGDQIMASKSGGDKYSIAELSDGERNALLIAGDVLTAQPGSLIVIDEPERHLHRSIVSPLLTSLFAKRLDCAFIVSTHDVELPLDNPSAKVMLIRGCHYAQAHAAAWDFDILENGEQIDPDVKRDIMGARRKIIFVEGDSRSLDRSIYSQVFPQTSIIPKGNCREVEQSTRVVRATGDMHWVQAWGIVDGDCRDQAETEGLAAEGVHAVPFYSVEAIYYHPNIVERVAIRQANVTGGDGATIAAEAIRDALDSLKPEVSRLAVNSAEKAVRRDFFDHTPDNNSVAAGAQVSIQIDTGVALTTAEAKLQSALNLDDWLSVLGQCSVRNSQALNIIGKKVGLKGRADYEKAVRQLLLTDQEALALIRSLFGSLYAEVVA